MTTTAPVTDDPRANGAKIRHLVTAGEGHADLYLTVHAGPSGQRSRLHVARIRYLTFGTDDFAIIRPSDGQRIGTARFTDHDGAWWWSITAECPFTGDLDWLGFASTLATGADWCIRGEHAATGRHDSARLGPGIIRNRDQVARISARRHFLDCVTCQDARETRGWQHCTA
jgi:hypothetical protein